jgi:HPt (histidine-containing phosphotransfer) domain-containing protein
MSSTLQLPGGSAHERLLLLRERFHHRLPDRLAAIGGALGSAASGGSFEELARLFHQLAGTAGTYGLEALTPIAREGEGLCLDVTRPRAERLSALDGVVRALGAAAGSVPS